MTDEQGKQSTDNAAKADLAVAASSAGVTETNSSQTSPDHQEQRLVVRDLPLESLLPVHVRSEDCIEMRRLHRDATVASVFW